MRTLVTVAVLVTLAGTAAAYDGSRCDGRYGGYPDWAQGAFCKPQGG